MAITVDTRSASAGSVASATQSWNHTINSGSDTILIVLAGSAASPARAVSTVFWDTAGVNEALTKLGGYQESDGFVWTEIWYKKAPTAGASKQITVTYAGSCECAAGAISLFGVDQTTTWNAASPNTGRGTVSTTQPNLTVTSAVGEYVVVGTANGKLNSNTDSPTPGATGTTILAVDVAPGAGNSTYAAADHAGAATSYSIAWTGFANDGHWAAIGGSLLPSAPATELKISQFDALTAPVAADLLCVVDSTTSKKLTIDNLLDLFISNTTLTVLTATSGAAYAPPAEAKKLLICAVGGGGGGNGGNNTDSAGGGGGGGGTVIKLVSSTDVTNGTYIVGPGGAASASGTASSGTNTTFNIDSTNIMTAGGGGGGTQGPAFTVVGVSVAGGAGGTATGGDLNMPGKRGDRGVIYSATLGMAGFGGDSVFGFGGRFLGANSTGETGGDYGGGGGGGHASAATNKEGGAGAKGTIFILEFLG